MFCDFTDWEAFEKTKTPNEHKIRERFVFPTLEYFQMYFDMIDGPISSSILIGTKNFYENGLNLFFVVQSYGNENGPDSYSQIRFKRFVTRLQTDLMPRFVCTSDTKLQTDFARR